MRLRRLVWDILPASRLFLTTPTTAASGRTCALASWPEGGRNGRRQGLKPAHTALPIADPTTDVADDRPGLDLRMGGWGAAIFRRHRQVNVREDFRDAIADGLSAAAATGKVLAEYGPDTADRPYAASVWLALAVTQWKLGRLEEHVRDALPAIDGGDGLAAWLGTQSEISRRDVLAKTRAQLLSCPRAAPVRRNLPSTCVWRPGDLRPTEPAAKLNHPAGPATAHRQGRTYPSLEVLTWQGKVLPNTAVIDNLPFARTVQAYIDSLHWSARGETRPRRQDEPDHAAWAQGPYTEGPLRGAWTSTCAAGDPVARFR